MHRLNSKDERKRLAEVYAAATEDELRKLADQAFTLTDAARTVLEREIKRRELPIELRLTPEAKELPEGLVTIRIFTVVADALLAKTVLDSAEIECFLFDENVIRMDWFYSNAVGGVKLLVRARDAAAATELLSQKSPEEFAVDGSADYKQPRCPKCGSLDISFGESGKRLSYVTVALGVPLPVKRGGWKCHSCGHSWEDSQEQQESAAPEGS
jgi:antitoxin component of RelBE/YafQ-DinJ toxin-antitoxin module